MKLNTMNVANVQTPSTLQSSRMSRRGNTPEAYDHFRKILKTRQKFPRSSDQKQRSNIQEEDSIAVEQIPRISTSDKLRSGKTTPQLLKKERSEHFYSMHNLAYKNYKYIKPPGTLDTAQYLEGTLKLGLKTGHWDKGFLRDNLNYKNLILKRSTYTCDHLMRSRKPQGPQSCLETIYIAKIQMEDNQTKQNQDKLVQLQNTLRKDITLDQLRFPSQAYQLNKWTRQSPETLRTCSKAELFPAYSRQKEHIESDITQVQKSIDNFKTFQESTITEVPPQVQFFKFEMKKNTIKSIYSQTAKTTQLLMTNFPIFTTHIIGERLLLSYGLTSEQPQQRVPFKAFENFYTVFISKKAQLKTMIDTLLQFFTLGEPLPSVDFCNLLRIICDQFHARHPNLKNVYKLLIENFHLSLVISGPIMDTLQFQSAFIANQVNIFDLVDLISN